MTQIKFSRPETAPLTYRLDPMGTLVGYAALCAELPARRPMPLRPQEISGAAFVPSCPFQWSAPTSTTPAPSAAKPADMTLGEHIAPHSEKRAQSWPARLWSRYVAWRERQRTAAAWEMLDTRTLRDIGATPDEVDQDLRSIPYWGWYTIL
jgi:uncharacterized protein YjiS (DUF1127 family)